jgi:hypothetical protein
MNVLPICNIKLIAVYFAREKREVYLSSSHEKRSKEAGDYANVRLELFKLLLCGRRFSEPHRIIWPWAKSKERYRAAPFLTNTFIQRFEMSSAIDL